MMSLLDGFSGYNQVWVKKEDRHKTTFTMPWGTFEYIRMPFGLTNAGATFQRAMDYAFKGLINKFIEIYQDDLTAFSKDGVSHINHLRQGFDRCREYGISLNPAKSIFGVTEGKLLGHIIFKDGIQIPALAFAAPVLGLYLFAVLRNLPDIGYNFRWRPADLAEAGIALFILALLLIPIGTHSGFIKFSNFDSSPAQVLETIFGVYFLVALPEELLFRGIIQNLLAKIFSGFRRSTWIALAVASSIFGLSHYNNFNPPDWRYVYLAALAGLLYGWTYIRTGRTTVSALVHCGVNVFWALFFKETSG